jgi:hypothetical protein
VVTCIPRNSELLEAGSEYRYGPIPLVARQPTGCLRVPSQTPAARAHNPWRRREQPVSGRLEDVQLRLDRQRRHVSRPFAQFRTHRITGVTGVTGGWEAKRPDRSRAVPHSNTHGQRDWY